MIRRTFIAVLLAAASLAAQSPARSQLPRDADPNDWEAYYDHGVTLLNQGRHTRAETAFHRAARLDPSRAEPPFALRVALFMRQFGAWERTLGDDPKAYEHPVIVRGDSLLAEAMLRNPFVPPTLEVLLYQELPGRWRGDARTQGMLAFAQQDVQGAARLLERAVQLHPNRVWQRMEYAQALVVLGRFDQAAEQVKTLLDELRARDERDVVRVYESKALLEYALGLLYLSARRVPEARASVERALVEDLSSVAARRGLALVARAQGRTADVVEEYARAVEIAGEHPLLAYEYGQALLDARRPADALPVLSRLVEREPHWAAARLQLARAHDLMGSRDEAVAAYEHYAGIAPRSAAASVASVRRRIETLRAPAEAAPAPPAN